MLKFINKLQLSAANGKTNTSSILIAGVDQMLEKIDRLLSIVILSILMVLISAVLAIAAIYHFISK